MSGRRDFLALVGDALVSGPTVRQWGISRPTLVFPQVPVAATSANVEMVDAGGATGHLLLDAHLAAGQSQIHAFIDIKRGLPEDLFYDLMEGDLRMVEGCKPGGRIHRAMVLEGLA